ncbi:MAG: 50S ribosomal protein L29 [Nitrososphaeria archaeon]
MTLKPSELRKMDDEELRGKLLELRSELMRLRAMSERGTIGKESGVIRETRRDIARVLTVLRERRTKA